MGHGERSGHGPRAADERCCGGSPPPGQCRKEGGPGMVRDNCRRRTTTTAAASTGPCRPVAQVVVCAEGPALHDRVDERFGRAACFQLVDLPSMTVQVLPNAVGREQMQAAGTAAVELVAAYGPHAAIVATVGPKAADAFARASIPVYRAAGMSVGEALVAFARGELPRC